MFYQFDALWLDPAPSPCSGPDCNEFYFSWFHTRKKKSRRGTWSCEAGAKEEGGAFRPDPRGPRLTAGLLCFINKRITQHLVPNFFIRLNEDFSWDELTLATITLLLRSLENVFYKELMIIQSWLKSKLRLICSRCLEQRGLYHTELLLHLDATRIISLIHQQNNIYRN